MHHALTEYARLHLSHGLGIMDALIASAAIGHELQILTFDRRHFKAIPGLLTIQLYER
jgi:predicted nucleic acid-binding protein